MPLNDTRRVRYYRRLAATGVSFLVFGFAGGIAGLTVLPLVQLWPGTRAQRRSRTRRVVSRFFRFFVRMMQAFGIMTLTVEGQERLGRRGQLVLLNHPSLIDIVVLIALVPEATTVVKGSLCRHPATRVAIRGAEYVGNDDAPTMVAEVCAALRDGQTVIMMPEGTRTDPTKPLHFHRGASRIAVEAAEVVTLATLRVVPTTLTKSEAWYQIPSRPFEMTLSVGDDVPLSEYREGVQAPIASRRLNDYLLGHFQAELDDDGRT